MSIVVNWWLHLWKIKAKKQDIFLAKSDHCAMFVQAPEAKVLVESSQPSGIVDFNWCSSVYHKLINKLALPVVTIAVGCLAWNARKIQNVHLPLLSFVRCCAWMAHSLDTVERAVSRQRKTKSRRFSTFSSTVTFSSVLVWSQLVT